MSAISITNYRSRSTNFYTAIIEVDHAIDKVWQFYKNLKNLHLWTIAVSVAESSNNTETVAMFKTYFENSVYGIKTHTITEIDETQKRFTCTIAPPENVNLRFKIELAELGPTLTTITYNRYRDQPEGSFNVLLEDTMKRASDFTVYKMLNLDYTYLANQ
jgi:hypothetical protein